MWQVLYDIQLGCSGHSFSLPTRAIGFSVDLRGSHVEPTYLGNAFVGVFALPPAEGNALGTSDDRCAQLVSMARSVRAATHAARDPYVGRCLLDMVHAPEPHTALHTLLSIANVQHVSVGQVGVFINVQACCPHLETSINNNDYRRRAGFPSTCTSCPLAPLTPRWPTWRPTSPGWPTLPATAARWCSPCLYRAAWPGGWPTMPCGGSSMACTWGAQCSCGGVTKAIVQWSIVSRCLRFHVCMSVSVSHGSALQLLDCYWVPAGKVLKQDLADAVGAPTPAPGTLKHQVCTNGLPLVKLNATLQDMQRARINYVCCCCAYVHTTCTSRTVPNAKRSSVPGFSVGSAATAAAGKRPSTQGGSSAVATEASARYSSTTRCAATGAYSTYTRWSKS